MPIRYPGVVPRALCNLAAFAGAAGCPVLRWRLLEEAARAVTAGRVAAIVSFDDPPEESTGPC